MALSTTNSDSADPGPRRHGAVARRIAGAAPTLYVKAAAATSDATISSASEIAAECQQIAASARSPALAETRSGRRCIRRGGARRRAALSTRGSRHRNPAHARPQRDEALIQLIGVVSDAGGSAIASKGLLARSSRPKFLTGLLAAGVDWRSSRSISPSRTARRTHAHNEPASGTARRSSRVLTPKATPLQPLPWRRKRRRSIRIPSASPTSTP